MKPQKSVKASQQLQLQADFPTKNDALEGGFHILKVVPPPIREGCGGTGAWDLSRAYACSLDDALNGTLQRGSAHM